MSNRRDYDLTVPGQMYYRYPNLDRVENVPLATRYYRSATDYPRRKKPTGILPATVYHMEEFVWKRAYGPYTVYHPSLGYVRYEAGFHDSFGNPVSELEYVRGRLGVPASFPSSLVDRAIMRLRLKIKDSSFNAAQAYAERKQTANLIAGGLTNIANAARDIRHGRFKRGLSHLGIGRGANPRNMTDAILAFQYGVKPLCSDIYGAIDALDKRDRKDWYVHAKVKVTETHDLSEVRDNPGSFGRDCYLSRGSTVYGASASAVLCPENNALITASSLGLTNPALIAWELAPFSFVYDWALPIGDWVSSWDALAGWEVLRFSVTEFERTKFALDYRSGQYDGFTYVNGCKAYFNRVAVHRTVPGTIPFAAFPKVKDPFSKQHVLNAVALLSSVFRGVK